ncbi:MAG TPA: hypothetical protein PKD64_19695 [Pirellulaceae bacterium]|nr:hypothetical protein [Pirellulaceae bacterium]HMO94415.1 hypothetical protein [Pirellulaceae bacterium]HMP71561.1 hypothetical protein [Pirellulaceae bacterium]
MIKFKHLLIVPVFVAIALTLLRQADLLASIVSILFWLLMIVWAAYSAFKASDFAKRVGAVLFLTALSVYTALAMIPDEEGNSPRIAGREWTTRGIRMSYGSLTGRYDLERHIVSSETSSSSEPDYSNSNFPAKEHFDNKEDEFEHLVELVEKIFETSNTEPLQKPFVKNLSGFGPWIEYRSRIQMYMLKGHIFMGILLGFVMRLIGESVIRASAKWRPEEGTHTKDKRTCK